MASLTNSGFQVAHGVLSPAECDGLLAIGIEPLASSVGSRSLLSFGWCQELAAKLRTHRQLRDIVYPEFVATQCTYFSKSSALNWLVPIHQDLSIPVAERTASPELRGWSEKQGEFFVQPPVELLEHLVAVRLHLDSCSAADGPLQVVPGSHSSGVISPETASSLGRSGERVSITLGQGDILAMRPLLLHASSKASGSGKRRVLHFLFGPPILPHGLRWRHAV
jgi:hypothetical protein